MDVEKDEREESLESCSGRPASEELEAEKSPVLAFGLPPAGKVSRKDLGDLVRGAMGLR